MEQPAPDTAMDTHSSISAENYIQTRVEQYQGWYDRKSVGAKAFRLFVERVEEAIASENAATLNVMTMASEPADSGKKLVKP